jgi:hypothetical protein
LIFPADAVGIQVKYCRLGHCAQPSICQLH